MTTATNRIRGDQAGVATVDMKLEAIVIPVSDVDRAEQFYRRLGWRQDVTPPGSGVFQFTPRGSWCSVQFGKGLTSAAPGSVQRTYLIVSDVEAARNALIDAGIEVSELFHFGPNGPEGGADVIPHGALAEIIFYRLNDNILSPGCRQASPSFAAESSSASLP